MQENNEKIEGAKNRKNKKPRESSLNNVIR